MDEPFDEEERPYPVGYKRPPKEFQFKKGNKAAAGKRKKKRQKTIADHIEKILGQNATIRKDGMAMKLANSETVALQLVNKAKKGDLAAVRLLVALARPDVIEPSPSYPDNINVRLIPPKKKIDVDD